jgi:hypothetical protein
MTTRFSFTGVDMLWPYVPIVLPCASQAVAQPPAGDLSGLVAAGVAPPRPCCGRRHAHGAPRLLQVSKGEAARVVVMINECLDQARLSPGCGHHGLVPVRMSPSPSLRLHPSLRKHHPPTCGREVLGTVCKALETLDVKPLGQGRTSLDSTASGRKLMTQIRAQLPTAPQPAPHNRCACA